MLRAVASSSWKVCIFALGGILVGLLAAIGAQAYYILFGGNFHTVIVGQVYRAGQPTANELERIVGRYQIRTVLNLRGDNDEEEWYVEERAMARRLGVRLEGASIWGMLPASEEDLARLVDVLRPENCPILLHCCTGGDRTGMAAALALLLLSDASLAEARGQLKLRFGHNPYGPARCHHLVLDHYENWLHTNGLQHEPRHLRRWVREDYRTSECLP